MDETWLYHYEPETKQQSVEWRHSGSPRLKKFRVHKTAGKVLASIFWDQDGILLIDYLPKGQTINAEYYSFLLVQLKDILKEKRCGNFIKGVLFLHENAPAHRALATQKKLAYLGFQYLDHLPYSPDLDPSDYNLLHGLKKQLKCRHSSVRRGGHCCRGEVGTDNLLILFLGGLRKLVQRAKNWIELHGKYA